MRDGMYMNDHLLAAEDTLIRYVGNGTEEMIPSRAGTLMLRTVGAGAVVAPNAGRLTIAEGYTSLKNQAIISCAKDARLELPASLQTVSTGFAPAGRIRDIILRRYSDPEEWRLLRETGLPCGEGRRLLVYAQTDGTSLALAGLVMVAVGRPMAEAHEDMCMLLEYSNNRSIFNTGPCYDLTGNRTQADEYAVVMRMIRDGKTGWRHPEAERRSDLRIRAGQLLPTEPEKLTVAEAETGKAKTRPDGCHELDIRVTTHMLMAPALRPVVLNGRRYFIYSRQYLTSNPECPYMREDMGVFSEEEGLLTDRKLSEEIYAKARMLMLL